MSPLCGWIARAASTRARMSADPAAPEPRHADRGGGLPPRQIGKRI